MESTISASNYFEIGDNRAVGKALDIRSTVCESLPQ